MHYVDGRVIDLDPFELEGCDIIEEINGFKFDTLPVYYRLKIKRSPIRATIIKKQSRSIVKYQMFMRLNTGGSLLSAQEIRNCSSRMLDGGEEFYSYLQRLSGKEHFKKAIGRLSDSDREQRGAEELVLRFFAISDFQDGFSGTVKEWLDQYMEEILMKERKFDQETKEELFDSVFGFVSDIWGGDAFARYSQGTLTGGRLPPAYYEAICGGLIENVSKIAELNHEKAREAHINILQSAEFKTNTGPGASSKTKLKARIKLFSDAFRAL